MSSRPGATKQPDKTPGQLLSSSGRHGRNNASVGGACPSVRLCVRLHERSVTPAAPGTKSSRGGRELPGVQGRGRNCVGCWGGN